MLNPHDLPILVAASYNAAMSYVMFEARVVEVCCTVCGRSVIGFVVASADGRVRLDNWASSWLGDLCGKCALAFNTALGDTGKLRVDLPIATLADLKLCNDAKNSYNPVEEGVADGLSMQQPG